MVEVDELNIRFWNVRRQTLRECYSAESKEFIATPLKVKQMWIVCEVRTCYQRIRLCNCHILTTVVTIFSAKVILVINIKDGWSCNTSNAVWMKLINC